MEIVEHLALQPLLELPWVGTWLEHVAVDGLIGDVEQGCIVDVEQALLPILDE